MQFYKILSRKIIFYLIFLKKNNEHLLKSLLLLRYGKK